MLEECCEADDIILVYITKKETQHNFLKEIVGDSVRIVTQGIRVWHPSQGHTLMGILIWEKERTELRKMADFCEYFIYASSEETRPFPPTCTLHTSTKE